ncbi:MAG: LTA synthase family protein [Pseudomonadota bacterium]
MRKWRSILQYPFAVGALVLPAWVFRVILMLEKGVLMSARSLTGFWADAAVAFVISLPLVAIGRRSRWAAVSAAVLWCLAQSAVYEHIRALNVLPLFTHAGYLLERTFLFGSFLRVTHAAVLTGLVFLSGVMMFSATRPCTRTPRTAWQVLSWAAALFFLMAGYPGDAADRWQRTHALAANLHVAAGKRHRPVTAETTLTASESAAVEKVFSRDLSGDSVFQAALGPPPNVLLIILESVSSLYLSPVPRGPGVPAGQALMPKLKRFSEMAVYAPRLITQQRQTNRGEYAILCGDLPALITDTPKMSTYQPSGENACLPAVLSGSGYRTAYLQAAPLSFMMKDVFMARAGFQSVHGREWFSRAYAEGKWGVDDRAFFEQSVNMIDDLNAGGRPWFLALLNVGTHHPFYLPETYPQNGDRQAAAFRHLDDALSTFLSTLAQRGVLDDTLVVITSDESAGPLGPAASAVDTLLGPNIGLFIAHLPSGEHLKVTERFMQSDIALSILDAVGVADRAPALNGRSLFRRYGTPRPIVFGNTYRRIVGALGTDDKYHICDESFVNCATYRLTVGAPVRTGLTREAMPDAERRFLRAVAVRSRSAHSDQAVPKDYLLTSARTVPLQPKSPRQIIYAGQYLSLAAGSRVAVSVEMRLIGKQGEITLENKLTSGRGTREHFRKPVALSAGERLRLSYLFSPETDMEGVECGAYVDCRPPDGLSLFIERATMRITPPASGPMSAGPSLTVLEASVTRP